jgi:hypothetical protein
VWLFWTVYKMLNKAAKYHDIDNAFHKKRKLFQKLIEVNEQGRMRRKIWWIFDRASWYRIEILQPTWCTIFFIRQSLFYRQIFALNFVNICLKLQNTLLFMIYISHLFLIIDKFINLLKLCGYFIYRQF